VPRATSGLPPEIIDQLQVRERPGYGRGNRSTSVVKGIPLDNGGVSLRADVSVAMNVGARTAS